MDNRLLALCGTIKKHNVIADIGCDHAYLSIYLIKNKLAKHVIASDINLKPLEKGKTNVLNEGVADNISLRLSFGFSGYNKNEIDAAVIAGMGGDTIINIIKNCQFKIDFPLYLQPMTCSEKLLGYLNTNGFLIKNHKAVCSGGRYYNIFTAINTNKKQVINQSPVFNIVGNLNLNDEIARALVLKKLKSLQKKANEIRPVERKKQEYINTQNTILELKKLLKEDEFCR